MTQINKGFKYFLRRAFDIREGEIDRAILMQLNIFLIISTLLIVKPTANSLFLSIIGVQNLPYVFLLVAFVAAIVSTIYSRLLPRYSLGKMITNTLLLSIGCLIIFGILLMFNLFEKTVPYLFYIWVSIFALLATSQFWILANIVFNAREAKRLFGFIGAGAIAGGIFGGYLTSLLAPVIGTEKLLLVGAGLLFLCLPITQKIWHKAVIKPSYYRQQKKTTGFEEHPFNLIKTSRHLTYLASIVGVSVIVAKLVDYQFSAVASSAINDPDELTAFFGFWLSNLNVVSLLIQLFITRRVVGTFGVGYSLFFLPGGILLGALALLFFPVLGAAVFIKICDGSLKQSINRASLELLALPIPAQIKNQTKTFIDVFIDSLATGIGGLLLIFVIKGLELPIQFISLIIIALIGLWGYFGWKIRKEYLKLFKEKIGGSKGKEEPKTINLEAPSVLGGLQKVLEQGTISQVLYVLGKVREINNDHLFENIRKLLNHPSKEIRAEALRTLYFYKRKKLVDEIRPMINDPDDQVKIRAFEYLIEHDPENIMNLMKSYLDDPDDSVSNAALISLAEETKDNPALRTTFELEKRIEALIKSIPGLEDQPQRQARKVVLLRIIGEANLEDHYQHITQYLFDENPEVAMQAVLSAGQTLSPEFIDILTEFLVDEKKKDPAKVALANYGNSIIGRLYEAVVKAEVDVEIVRQFPSVVELINSQKSVDFLFQLLSYEDHTVRLEALRGLNTLKIKHPHLKFKNRNIIQWIVEEARVYLDTLSVLYAQIAFESKQEPNIRDARKSLIDLLERRLDGNLERIFRLLGLKYPPEDIIPIFEGIQSKKPDIRLSAVEFLDNLLEPSLKRILLPVVETATLDNISEEVIKQLNLSIPDDYDCFETLLKAKDVKIKLAVLYLIGQLNEPRFLPLIEQYRHNENKRVRDFAEKALEELS